MLTRYLGSVKPPDLFWRKIVSPFRYSAVANLREFGGARKGRQGFRDADFGLGYPPWAPRRLSQAMPCAMMITSTPFFRSRSCSVASARSGERARRAQRRLAGRLLSRQIDGAEGRFARAAIGTLRLEPLARRWAQKTARQNRQDASARAGLETHKISCPFQPRVGRRQTIRLLTRSEGLGEQTFLKNLVGPHGRTSAPEQTICAAHFYPESTSEVPSPARDDGG